MRIERFRHLSLPHQSGVLGRARQTPYGAIRSNTCNRILAIRYLKWPAVTSDTIEGTHITTLTNAGVASILGDLMFRAWLYGIITIVTLHKMTMPV